MNERMLKRRRSTIYLPEDLVVEILSRVPLASLARLRWASKEWNALIKDKILAKKPSQVIMLIDSRVHLVSIDLHEINNDEVKIINQLSLKDPLSSEEVNIRNVFHCDGLLLCSTEDKRLVVWNPCSRETRWIQPRNSYKQFDFYALGKSSCSKYKILRIDQYFSIVNPGLLKFEIYDITSNSWRVVGATRDPFILRWKSLSMSVNGNTYWLAFSQNKNEDFLLSFDFTRERFGRESLPGDHLSYSALSLSVTREDQQLCLLATRGLQVFDVDVWIATNGVMSWSKFLSIDVHHLPKPFYFLSGMHFLVDQEKKVLVCHDKPWVSNNPLLIVGEDRCIKVAHNDAKCRCSNVASYVPSFVQIQPTGSFEETQGKYQS